MTVVSRRYRFYSEQVVTRDPAIVRVYLGLLRSFTRFLTR